jgi:hypothetical protein
MAGSASNSQPPQIATASSNKEVIANGNFNAASPGMYGGQDATTTNGLTWGYIGGWWGGALVPKGTLTLTASATNYVYWDNITGAFTVSTVAPGAGKTLAYTIVVGATTVTSWTDNRQLQLASTVTSVGATGGVETDQAAGAAITGSGNIRETMYLAGGAVQTAAYTFVAGDRGTTLVMNSASAVTEPLPAPTGSSGNFKSGWFVSVNNIGNGATTMTMPSSSVQLDGVANGTLALTKNTGALFFTDGTNYFTVRGAASGGGGSSTLAGLTDVAESGQTNNQLLAFNNSTSKWNNVNWPQDFISFYPGAPSASAKVLSAVVAQAMQLPQNLTGSFATAGTAATASTTFNINKNGSNIGTINFGAGATTGTFTFSAAVSFAAGDLLQIVAPGTPDATLADVNFTIVGNRT